MNFLRLHDPLMGLLFEDDDIIAVDKPYGIDSHTNEAKKGNEAFVIPGLIELYEAQLGQALHIIHRLDQTTTGVIIFGKSLESAKKYQAWFRARETKKTYVFVTGAASTKDRYSTDKTILHKGDELEASTDFHRIASSCKFHKWEAHPHTGRNHQIRIHAAHLGLPLLGDEKYGGRDYSFLCLHNRRIEFPNGVVIESGEPVYFKNLDLLEAPLLATALHEIDRRKRLFSKAAADQSLRLVHNSGGGATTLDQLGEILSLGWYRDGWSNADGTLYEKLAETLEKPILVRMMSPKMKDKSGKAHQVFLGLNAKGKAQGAEDQDTPKAWQTREGDATFELRTDTGQSLGLFPDQRLHREWVRKNSQDKSVLNLFSYTGNYSVAAALGGAREVTSVDTGKAALNWSRKNFELNKIAVEKHKFLNRDAVQFLEQCAAKEQTFDLIICDAPSFSRGESGLFKLEVEIEKLLTLLLKTLNAQGELIFATHHEQLFTDDLRKLFLKTAGRDKIEINSIQSSLDFELPGEKTLMKSFLIRKVPS